MAKTKTTTAVTEIIVERDELRVVKPAGKQNFIWCAQCKREVQIVRLEEAMTLAGVSFRTITQWIEVRTVHFAKTEDGQRVICVRSINRRP